MNLLELIRDVEIFKGLTQEELGEIAALCTSRQLQKGEELVREGEPGEEFYIISKGSVEVVVGIALPNPRTIVHLGEGQVIGEMALIDQGVRSASVRAINSPTDVQVIRNKDFLKLCERNTKIGFVVMRNLAADLSFKLRHLNLIKQV